MRASEHYNMIREESLRDGGYVVMIIARHATILLMTPYTAKIRFDYYAYVTLRYVIDDGDVTSVAMPPTFCRRCHSGGDTGWQ